MSETHSLTTIDMASPLDQSQINHICGLVLLGYAVRVCTCGTVMSGVDADDVKVAHMAHKGILGGTR